MVAILIERLASGAPSPFDGKWLREYDPGRDGVSPDGRRMLAHVVVTERAAEALSFPTMVQAFELYRRPDPRHPERRPLTAFSVSMRNVDRMQSGYDPKRDSFEVGQEYQCVGMSGARIRITGKLHGDRYTFEPLDDTRHVSKIVVGSAAKFWFPTGDVEPALPGA